MSGEPSKAAASARRNIVAGLAVLAALVFGFGGWAVFTEISGAVIAPGNVAVDTKVKKVQHLAGGIVSEIAIREGARVRAGDIVIRLDDTVVRANLAIVVKGIDEFDVRQARLLAERDELAELVLSESLRMRKIQPDVDLLISGEQRLLNSRRATRAGQKAQLEERIGQLQEELQGIASQTEAKTLEMELIQRELGGVRELWNKKLVPITRVTALERETARIGGERGHLIAAAAQAKGKITETRLQIVQIDQDLKTEVSKELREIQARLAELAERKIAAEDQLRRIDIRAPQDGVVHLLSIHTVGGVVGPGEQLMLIVPDRDDLVAEIKIPPQDIDQVRSGQVAVLKFATFNQRTTPEIIGTLITLSPDIAQDSRTGISYYDAKITISEQEIAKLNGLTLMPGMPLEAFIKTDNRTVISYLTKPLQEQIARAFVER